MQNFLGSRQDPLFCFRGLPREEIYLGAACLVLFIILVFLPLSGFKQTLLIFSSDGLWEKRASQTFTLGPFAKPLTFPDFYLIQKNSLKAISPVGAVSSQVLASLLGESEEDASPRAIIEYEVKQGDSFWSIAQDFNISVETILWANNLSQNSQLRPGKKLVILPVSGVMHLVKAGETLGEIVKKHKGNLEETIAFNDLESENEIFIGDIIIIPHGVLPAPPKKPAPVLAPLTAGYFICPIAAPCRVTQGLHWYNAIDFSHGLCWEPVMAAAQGTVQKAKTTTSASRWAFNGAGNHITILHPSGVVTFYGHLAGVLVSPGQPVSQGDIIGFIGGARGMAGSGNSTGCHLHFGVVGARNPFAR